MNESLAGIFELIQEEENGLEEEEAEEGEDPGDMFNLDAGRKFLLNYDHLANSPFHNPFNCHDPPNRQQDHPLHWIKDQAHQRLRYQDVHCLHNCGRFHKVPLNRVTIAQPD